MTRLSAKEIELLSEFRSLTREQRDKERMERRQFIDGIRTELCRLTGLPGCLPRVKGFKLDLTATILGPDNELGLKLYLSPAKGRRLLHFMSREARFGTSVLSVIDQDIAVPAFGGNIYGYSREERHFHAENPRSAVTRQAAGLDMRNVIPASPRISDLDNYRAEFSLVQDIHQRRLAAEEVMPLLRILRPYQFEPS